MEDDPGASEHVIETLRNRGWCFGDLEQVKAIIIIHTALADDSGKVVDSVESELADMDLTIIGGKSLPDSSVIRKSSHLPGPKVLQAVTPFYIFCILLCLVPEKMREFIFFVLLFGFLVFINYIFLFFGRFLR